MSQPGLTTLTQRHIYDRAISCTDSSNLGKTLAMTVQREREREREGGRETGRGDLGKIRRSQVLPHLRKQIAPPFRYTYTHTTQMHTSVNMWRGV